MNTRELGGLVTVFFIGCLAYYVVASPRDTAQVKRVEIQGGACGDLTFDKDFNWVGDWKSAPRGEDPTCISSANALVPAAFTEWCKKGSACSVPVLFKGWDGRSRRLAHGTIVAVDETATKVRILWKKGDVISPESPGGKGVLERQKKPW